MVAFFENRPIRPLVTGSNGAVSSGHPLASMAGVRVLQQGGNACDAAVAVAAALNVVEPFGSGAGGDSFSLVYEAATGRVLTVNATGPAPSRATPDRYREGIPDRGPQSISVPGAVSGWATLSERWGRLPLGDALAPAIELAEEGFPLTHNNAESLATHDDTLRQYSSTSSVFRPGGRPLQPLERLVQHDLGRTFQRLSDGGQDEFYRGELARQICAAVQDAGGILDADSMASYRAEVVDPISVEYRDSTVVTPAPNSTGHVLLQELMMLQEFDPGEYDPDSPDLAHLLIEMKKLAFSDRERYNADPHFVDPLPDFLLSKSYARERVQLIDQSRARPTEVPSVLGGGDDTTYFAVVDRDGNAVSTTTSINAPYGSGFMPAGTGVLLNNRMRYWHLEGGHPNQLQPGKRVRHTVSPVIVLRDGEPSLVIGTPGADGQVQTILQVMVRVLDYAMNPQLAVELPRWRSFSPGHESNYPHGSEEGVQVDYRFPDSFVDGLRQRGHNVAISESLFPFGSCQLISVARRDDRWAFGAAADPRRDGYALAW